MVTNKFMEYFVWVTLSGDCYIAQRSVAISSTNVSPLESSASNLEHDINSPDVAAVWNGYSIYSSLHYTTKATCAAINSKMLKVAIGTENGEVLIYNISEDKNEVSFSFTCVLPQPPGTSAIEVGRVSSLDWTADGCAIAVGWLCGGLSIWSCAGRLLLCTLSEEIISESPYNFYE